MGNVFVKSKNQIGYHANNDLNRSLIHCDLIEKINYLENKLDMLDDKLFVLEGNTQANIKVLSSDVHHLHQEMVSLKK
jgi:hypothetical protein